MWLRRKMRLTDLLANSQSSHSSSSGNRVWNPFCMQGRYDFGCQTQEGCLHSEWMISSLVLSPKDEGHFKWFVITLYWVLWEVLRNIPAYILMEEITFSLLDILCSSLYYCQKVFVHKRQQLDINNCFFPACIVMKWEGHWRLDLHTHREPLEAIIYLSV